MRQIWITRAGQTDALQIREAPTPLPRTGEVRVRVEVAGVSYVDVLGRHGRYAFAPRGPYIPGYEVAGRVEALGQGVRELKEGDEVLALTNLGGYSEQLCVPQSQVFKRLEWMSAEDGAALPLSYLMAYVLLVVMGSVRHGSSVLIHSAGGSVGVAAVDICRIVGAETYGTASPEKHALLQERGLSHPIDYRNRHYEEAVRELRNGKGLDLILEPFGGGHWQKNYALLAPTGRLLHYGASGLDPYDGRSPLSKIRHWLTQPAYTPTRLTAASKGVLGLRIGSLFGQDEILRRAMEQLISWYDEALFRPHIDRTFPFERAAAAHALLESRKNVGKVLLRP